MVNALVTLATFPTPVEAGFVKNLLEADGIRAFVADEMTAGMFWQLGNTIGWIKLQVAQDDFARANEILDEHHRTVAEMGQEAFVAEATRAPPPEESAARTGVVVCPGCGRQSDAAAEHCWYCGGFLGDVLPIATEPDELSETVSQSSAVAEADDEVEDPVEELASRAFRAAGIGLIFFPVLIYAAWLIGRLIFTKSELSDRASRRMWLAFAITVVGFVGYWAFFRLSTYGLYDSSLPVEPVDWRV